MKSFIVVLFSALLITLTAEAKRSSLNERMELVRDGGDYFGRYPLDESLIQLANVALKYYKSLKDAFRGPLRDIEFNEEIKKLIETTTKQSCKSLTDWMERWYHYNAAFVLACQSNDFDVDGLLAKNLGSVRFMAAYWSCVRLDELATV